MRLLKIFPILISVIILSACTIQGEGDCKLRDNVVISFSMLDFPDHIDRVNIAVVDASGRTIETRQLEKLELDIFSGSVFDLESGEYTVVCWANAFDNTHLNGFATTRAGADFWATHINSDNGQRIATNDKLYHGKMTFTVNRYEMLRKSVKFTAAHHKISVVVEGLPALQSGLATKADYPKILINGVDASCGYDKELLGNKVTYDPIVSVGTYGGVPFTAAATANIFPHYHGDQVILEVYEDKSMANKIASIDLWQFIQDNSIDVDRDKVAEIPVKITYTPGGVSNVTITIIPWNELDTLPEF